MRGLKRTRVFTGILTILLLGGGLVLHAQFTEGTLVGTVTDPTGAAVPGARVIITSGETGQVTELETNDIGFYRAPSLRPGRYEIRVEASGFKAAMVSDVDVNVNVTTRTDVGLQLGTLAETVTVTEATRLIETEEARLKDTFTTREITELPLNGREVFQLMSLQPGVTATAAPVISNVPSPTAPVTFDFGFQANGATPRANNFLLDGTSNNNEWLGGTPLIFPSVDAIEEFQVQTLNFSAEYGRTNGGIVNVVTQGGANDIHGTVFYFHRNTALNARNAFDLIDKTPLQHHQFGFALGGPIVKNKTFFFANYEGSRRKDGAPELTTGETPEFRNQVFALPFAPAGSIAAQFLQDFPSPDCVGNSRDTGSIADPAFGAFAVGPLDTIPDVCDVVASQVQDHRADQYIVRVDHNFADNDRLFVRWVANDAFADVSRQELINANMRGFRSPLDGFFADLHVGYTHLLSPSLINIFHFAFARNDSEIFFEVPSSTSLDMLETAGTPDFFAHLSFDDGVIPFGGPVYIPREFIFNTWTIADTLTQVVGRHSLKYGFELRYIQENSNYELETRPFYEFNSIFNFANDQPWLVEALVNRDPSSPNFGDFQDTPRKFRWTQWAAFVQDDWKVLPNLTLNLGLRYEVFGRPTETEGRLNNVTLGSGSTFSEQLANATVGRVDHLFDVDYNNFAPRLGIAWDPTGSGKTVIRSGFSLAYIESYSNLHTNASRFDPPDATFIDICPVCGWGTGVDYTFPFESDLENANPVTPNGGAVGVSIFPSATREDLRTAYSVQWFLGVQQEFLRDYAFSINYVGTHGVALYIREDWNRFTGDFCSDPLLIFDPVTCDFAEDRLTPGWGGGLYASNGDGSIYHGANAQVRKNFSRGFMFVANYTFGKSLDIVTEGGLGDYFNVNNYGLASYQGAADVRNRRLDRGPSEFDVRQRFTLTSLWDLPSPASDSAAVRKLLGGWQVNSIISLQSARPFDVFCTLLWFQGCDFNMDGLEKDRPNAPAGVQTSGFSNSELTSVGGVFGSNLTTARETFCPVDPATGSILTMFQAGGPCVTVGTNGTLGRNAFRGPALYSVDLAIFKNTDITEKVKIQFRAEFFNLFNRVNLFNPVGNLSSSNFGRSLSAFAPRQIQFGLKLIF
jgi:hypothetical protein